MHRLLGPRRLLKPKVHLGRLGGECRCGSSIFCFAALKSLFDCLTSLAQRLSFCFLDTHGKVPKESNNIHSNR